MRRVCWHFYCLFRFSFAWFCFDTSTFHIFHYLLCDYQIRLIFLYPRHSSYTFCILYIYHDKIEKEEEEVNSYSKSVGISKALCLLYSMPMPVGLWIFFLLFCSSIHQIRIIFVFVSLKHCLTGYWKFDHIWCYYLHE